MPIQWETFPIEFRGGLVSNQNNLKQGIEAPGSATFLQNFEPSKLGGYRKVKGYTKWEPTEVPGTGLVLGLVILNQSEVVAARRNALDVTEYFYNDNGGWTSLGSAANLGGKVRAFNYNFDGNAKVMLVDGVNQPAIIEYTGSTKTLTWPTMPAELTGAEQVTVFKQTMFFAKGSNLHFSAPFAEGDFTAANGGGVINVGDPITGLAVFREQLIIFSANKIQRLVGNTGADFQLQPITYNIGCPYGDTIQEVGGDIMYMAPDGLRLLSATERIGDFGLEIASAPVSKEALRFINGSTQFSSLVVREKAQYRVFSYLDSIPERDSKGLLGVKFSDQGASNIEWATLSGFKVYSSDSKYVGGREIILFSNSDGFVYQLETGTSRDGGSIDAIYRSPNIPVNDPQLRKTFYKIAVYADTEGLIDIDLNVGFDIFEIDNYHGIAGPKIKLTSAVQGVFTYGSPAAIYGQATYGSKVDNVYNTNIVGSGKTISFQIEDKSANTSFALDTIVLEYKTNDRK